MTIWKRENEFDPLVAQASARFGVPVHIIKGVMAKESGFNPQAYRSEPQINDASRGLMQVLLETAVMVGYKGDVNGLYDPATGVNTGTAVLNYYRNLAKRIPDGWKWEDVLSMYNAGMVKGKDVTSAGKPIYRPRKKADGTYVNQSYVDYVKVYAGYFNRDIPEPAVKEYQRTQILKIAAPALGGLLALGFLALLYFRYRPFL